MSALNLRHTTKLEMSLLELLSRNFACLTSERVVALVSCSSNDGIAALTNKMEGLGCDMKKLKEIIHAIQVGCQICEGPHLDKDRPLKAEVKQAEEAKYGEMGRTAPFDTNRFRAGPFGSRNTVPYGERRLSLEEILHQHREESNRRSTEME